MTNVIYKIHTNDGSMYDGIAVASKKAAIAEIRRYRGHARCYLAEHCNGDAWSVYGKPTERDADRDGAYADTITRVELDRRVR